MRKPTKKVELETSSSEEEEPEYDDSMDIPSDDSEEFYEGTTNRCRDMLQLGVTTMAAEDGTILGVPV